MSKLSVGENIRKVRTIRNISRKELAEKLNLSISAIQKYENGTVSPTIDTLVKISEALNVTIDYLLGISNILNLDDGKIINEEFEKLNKSDIKKEEVMEWLTKFVLDNTDEFADVMIEHMNKSKKTDQNKKD